MVMQKEQVLHVGKIWWGFLRADKTLAGDTTKIKIKIDFSLNDLNKIPSN